jgi:AraC family transcriptional regulator
VRPSTPSPERGTWDFSPGGWKQLFGSFQDQGISLEWHDFQTSHEIPWNKSFHDESLEICINIQGSGEISGSRNSGIQIKEQTVGLYTSRRDSLKAIRPKDERHEFLTIELSKSYLEETLQNETQGLRPLVRSFLESKDGSQICPDVQPLNGFFKEFVANVRDPQVPEAAKSLWFRCKTLEAMTKLLFEEKASDELFCVRQKRVNRERVDKLKRLLNENLDRPLHLKELSKAIGCSPFYLSRTFSQETGTTIPKFLRQLRIERAAELLRSGEFNVTEAAMEVGYSSPSHFTKAFHDIMHCCPGLYTLRKK